VVIAVLFLRDGLEYPLIRDADPGLVAAVSIGGMGAIWLVAHCLIWFLGRRMDKHGDLRSVGRCDAIVIGARILAVGFHAFNILALDWLNVVRDRTGNLVLIDEFLAMLPVLLVYVGTSWSMYPIERRLREAVMVRELDEGRPPRPLPSRTQHVLSVIRHQMALVLLPALAILAWYELLERGAKRVGPPHWLPLSVRLWLPLALQLLGTLAVLSLMPAVLRRVWDTIRLDPGPLREILDRMCRDQRVRIRELLVWRTHGTMLNGAVMGLFGPVRYILLTDALLESLTGVQVEAVMAHEIGHIRRRHMIWLGIAGLGAILLGADLGQWALARYFPAYASQDLAQSLVLLITLPAAIIWLGYVSRRFEWQADAFAVQHLSGSRPGAAPVAIDPEAVVAMSSALDTVARLNHIPRHRFSFRHGSIASRQHHLKALIGQRTDRLKPDRDAILYKAAAALVFIAAIALAFRLGVPSETL
jgi:Zn-dependent protease with chaperone function